MRVKLWWIAYWVRASSEWKICSGVYLPTVVQGRSTGELVTESGAPTAHWCVRETKANPFPMEKSGLV